MPDGETSRLPDHDGGYKLRPMPDLTGEAKHDETIAPGRREWSGHPKVIANQEQVSMLEILCKTV